MKTPLKSILRSSHLGHIDCSAVSSPSLSLPPSHCHLVHCLSL